MPDGDNGASRLVRFSVQAPPCHSSMPASAPCSCTASVIKACARMSLSSHSVANGSGESSELGWMDTAPVQTTPQPPFGLDSAEGGAHLRQCIGHAAGVRYLIETVRRRDRPDAYRLEQDVEARIARHCLILRLRGAVRDARVIDRSYSSNTSRSRPLAACVPRRLKLLGRPESPKLQSQCARHGFVSQLAGMNVQAARQSRHRSPSLGASHGRRAPSRRATSRWSVRTVEVRGTAPGILVTQ